MDITNIGYAAMPAKLPTSSMSNRDQAVSDFNTLLMEMFVRQSGMVTSLGGEDSPEGAVLGDLMTQVLSSQLASQFHFVTAADLFGTEQKNRGDHQ